MMDIVGNLPVELAQKIFVLLPPDDVCNAWNCSTQWKYQMEDEMFWKKRCKLDDFNELEESERTETYVKFIQHFPNYWMGVYMYSRALYSNWMNNDYKRITVTGEKMFIALKHLDKEIAILATMGNEMVILDSSTGHVQKTFKIDEPVVSDFHKYKDMVIGHGLQQFKVWNITSGECLFQYVFEGVSLKLVTLYKNLVATLNDSHEVRIIDIEAGVIVYGRDDIVTLCLDNDMLALSNFDGEIEILNLNFNQMKMLKPEGKIEPLEIVIKGDYLIHFCRHYIPRGRSYFAFIWNVRTGKVLRQITSIYHYKAAIFLHDDKLIYSTVSQDSKNVLKYYNFITGEVIATLYNSFASPFTAANNKFIFMESNVDGSANGWCLKTGNLIIKSNIKNSVRFLMTEQKLAYFDDDMNFHILNYEHNLKY